MKLAKLIAAAILAVSPVASQAETLTARTSSSIEGFFLNEGAEVEVLEDNVGDPQLEVDYYGTEFTVFYYGCDNGADCDSIQFYSGYAMGGSVRLKTLNEYNAEKRWVRAYVAEDGAVKLEMDVFLGKDGVSADDFATMVSLWSRHMADFEGVIGFVN
ncbi:YbjN domain-containing protein [Pseudophaeobacter leonis]|uniref:YbjN domain-containing protein n=1 Tax=Pseudophaeobacter leonis TaxID=1144477 RepID=UPI0009F65884|nr:YbjN domain-containing protein [Pseudophaeobacter leonis]